MPNINVDLEDIKVLCPFLTIKDYNSGWYTVEESKKKVHGFNKLKELNQEIKNAQSNSNCQKSQQINGNLSQSSKWKSNQNIQSESTRINTSGSESCQGFNFGTKEQSEFTKRKQQFEETAKERKTATTAAATTATTATTTAISATSACIKASERTSRSLDSMGESMEIIDERLSDNERLQQSIEQSVIQLVGSVWNSSQSNRENVLQRIEPTTVEVAATSCLDNDDKDSS